MPKPTYKVFNDLENLLLRFWIKVLQTHIEAIELWNNETRGSMGYTQKPFLLSWSID